LWFFGWGVSIGANTSTTTIGSTLFSFLFFSLSLARALAGRPARFTGTGLSFDSSTLLIFCTIFWFLEMKE